MFSIVYRLFFVNLNLQSTIQTQLFIQDPRNPSAWRKCETPDSRHPGREKAKTWDFFAQLSIGRQNHSSTMNIHHSSTMIPVRENSEVVIKFTQTNGYIYNGLKPPTSHSSTMNIQATPPFLRKTLRCHGSLSLPYWPRFPERRWKMNLANTNCSIIFHQHDE